MNLLARIIRDFPDDLRFTTVMNLLADILPSTDAKASKMRVPTDRPCLLMAMIATFSRPRGVFRRDGAFDWKRDGDNLKIGWVADVLNGEYVNPGKMLCKSNTSKFSEKWTRISRMSYGFSGIMRRR